MTKKRPLGITILAVLVAIAAAVSIYHTLQFLHILPFSLGPIRFFAFDLLGALFWGLTAAALIWVVSALWNLKPEGWMFVVVMAIFDLILVFISILGQSSFQAMLPAILINVLLLIYCFLPGVKAAFAPPEEPAPPAAAPTYVRTMPAPPAAQVPEPVVRSAAVPLETPAVEPVAPPVAQAPVEPAVRSAEVPLEMAAEAPAEEPPVEQSPAPHGARPRPRVDIETIEGIGPTYAAKLKEIGILTVADLLQVGASRKGREDLVEKTGVSAKLILKWVNMADLMRISGVGEEYSELLEAAGVDTVKELKMRNPDNLHAAMVKVNEEKQLVRRTPHLNDVHDWVEQAKLLEAVITY